MNNEFARISMHFHIAMRNRIVQRISRRDMLRHEAISQCEAHKDTKAFWEIYFGFLHENSE